MNYTAKRWHSGTLATAACLGVAGHADAASVACKIDTRNPVCAASFAQNPPGTLARGVRTTGSAMVKGKRVNWTCIGGNPRNCSF